MLLLGVGAVSALYGILQASVASDLKRLLAYSTTENVGLMLPGGRHRRAAARRRAGRCGRRRAHGVRCCSSSAMPRSRLTLFLGAGSVLHATGERDLDRLGGLAPAMPVDVAGVRGRRAGRGRAAGDLRVRRRVGAAAVADPRRTRRRTGWWRSLLPVAVAVVALTAGLALLTFVKAYGIAFLARPAVRAAAGAHEVGAGRCGSAMVLGGRRVVVLGLVPGPVAAALAAAVGAAGTGSVGAGSGLDLSGVWARCSTRWRCWPCGAGGACRSLVGCRGVARRRARAGGSTCAWGCGGVRVSPRMQYTATSYAEPLVRVFDDALQPDTRRAGHPRRRSRGTWSSGCGSGSGSPTWSRTGCTDPVRRGALGRVGRAARRLQNGSIHRYLGYSFAAPCSSCCWWCRW